MDYYIIESDFCQDENLESEIFTKFTAKRLAADVLSLSYFRLGFANKAFRVKDCGTWLEFRRALGRVSAPPSASVCAEAVETSESSEGWKLYNANFCRDRLCPMCSWRRTYKVYSQVSRIMDSIQNDYIFLFLTLTIPNCTATDLSRTIDDLQKGWYKFINYKRVKNPVKGYFKALEVTRNTVRLSRFYDTYHPHFHCILAVNKSYFKSCDYIPHSEWLQLWRRAMKNPTITQVDIRRCKDTKDIKEGEQAVKALSSAVAEVAKYSVKSADFLGRFNKDGFLVDSFPDDEIDHTVSILSSALHHRRLVSFGGIFDEVSKKLQLDDCEDGDLIRIDGSEIRPDVAYMIRKYHWSCGFYKLLEEYSEVNVEVCDFS